MDSEGTRAPTHPPTHPHTHTHTHRGGGWWEQGGVQGWKSAANIMAMCVWCVWGGGCGGANGCGEPPPLPKTLITPPPHPLFPFTVTRLTYSLEFSRSSSDSLQSSSD
jgi:hypothetical protein